ncbi:hypothetical protein EC968_008204 [Mortierella alpina]|nr:hypothetical protein EC968_008204 [Mortierella alpina]
MRPPLESPEPPPLVPESEDLSLNGDSGYGSLLDAEVPSLVSRSSAAPPPSLESSLAFLRKQFTCTHSLATKARKRFEQTRNHPDRIHPADEHVLPPDPEQLPLQEVVKLYIEQYHMSSLKRAMAESVTNKVKGDNLTLFCPVERRSPRVIAGMLQFRESASRGPVGGHGVPIPCRLLSAPFRTSALEMSREDIAEEQDAYSGFLTLAGRVSKVFLTEHVLYSQTFICINPKCCNRNCLHFMPSATRNRVIKRTEDEGFMETGSSATLLPIDLVCSHCNMEMPESVIDRVYSVQQKIVLDCLNATRAEGCFVNQIGATLKDFGTEQPIDTTDDLVNTAALGESIQLLGRLSRTVVQKSEGSYLHGIELKVNNVLKLPDGNTRLPESIESILRSNMSPWNTSQAIVSLLDYIIPKDVYRKLKLALLLSAVSIEDHDCTTREEEGRARIRRSVHVLVINNCHDKQVPSLLASIGQSRSSVYWSHGADVYRQPLYTLHQTRKASTGCINGMDRDDIHIQHEDSTLVMDVRCCCWSLYTNAVSGTSATNNEGALPGEANTKPAEAAPLVELFDLVIAQGESNAASDVSQAIAAHTMRRHMLDHSDRVGTLLSRMEFTSLCLREVSDAGDALVSIMMVEETMAARFDGKDNISLLYGDRWSPDTGSDTIYDQEELTVPAASLQERDRDVNALVSNTGDSASTEEARDRCMERMYAHLMQVIKERSDDTHTTTLER